MSSSCDVSPSTHIARQPAPTGHEAHRVPHLAADGELLVDPWWGSIQPASLHPDIPTVGELEVIEHLRAGGLAIDTRKPEYVAESGTIPGARPIHWEHVDEHLDLFSGDPVVLFCNGPQCAATPWAIERLLDAGVAPEKLIYYRGGLQDWMGLGLPVESAE